MAASSSSSISNFLSFLLPSKPPLPKTPPPNFISPPPHADPLPTLSVSAPPPSQFDARTPRDGLLQRSSSSDLMAVVCPSLAYSNTLFFKSAYNVQVIVEDNEPEEKLLNRFRREVMRAGVIQECKRRRFFENKQDEKKRKTREAAKRNRRRRPQSRFSTQDSKQEGSKNKKDDDEEDNWEVPEGDLPF
ncbi:30S ribosomal protein S21, chloroplastic [Vitis riparia]|uniref:30S ribosomal protein S21, chloroplastic n=1 Tax=Vitis riparia TaxID=96939 RepID=UPI00155B022E|nr:30S ribosomal protein S21, chloroplastic [Vitis riparia]